jgi:hypothetical protein
MLQTIHWKHCGRAEQSGLKANVGADHSPLRRVIAVFKKLLLPLSSAASLYDVLERGFLS